MAALGASAFAVLMAAQWIVVSASDPLELLPPLALAGLALVLGVLGRNSLRRRRLAMASIVISTLTLLSVVAVGVRRAVLLPIDPWFDAMQVAQANINRAEMPAEQIVWSNRAPFAVPAPTVQCECFTAGDRPTGPLPHAADASVTFTNRCTGPVTFALSRSRSAMLAGAYPWFAATGRDFAVVTLTPNQAVRVPLGGTFGGAVQPWICQSDASVPAQQP